jgi:starch-binding outer membrane protein, SusD/RagB family
MNKPNEKLVVGALAGLAALSLAACGDLNVPDLNDPGLDEFQMNPTPASIAAAAVGLVIEMRDDTAANNGYVSHLGILGRESYNLDGSDPRFITELLEGMLNPGNRVFGGNFWENPYKNIRSANILLAATDAVAGLEMAQKEAVRGWTKTIMALEYLRVINTHDTNGAVIQSGTDLRTLDPIATKEQVFAHIEKLLDEAKTHLLAGGMAFPFQPGSGFAGFDTPMTFLRANRAIKARVDVYTGDNAGALAALGESFLSADAAMPNLQLGIYMAFSTGSGDRTNPLTDPNIFVNPSVRRGAEMQPNGGIDARVAAKVTKVMERTLRALTSDEAFTMYQSPSAPIPIIRNEELILLRAEASIATNLPQAIMDVNFIREKSGGLAPRTDLTAQNILDEILKQRFYSLLFEGGHRWIDMRRHGRLDQLPNDHPMATMDVPAHVPVHPRFPIPQNETDARNPPATM